MRACGRHDLITPEDYFDDMPETPEFARPQQSRWKIPHWRHRYTGSVSLPATVSSSESAASSLITSAVDYFAEVYADKHITHQTGDHDITGGEHSDMERTKKRKGIEESEATAYKVAERFRNKTGDGIDHFTVKVVW